MAALDPQPKRLSGLHTDRHLLAPFGEYTSPKRSVTRAGKGRRSTLFASLDSVDHHEVVAVVHKHVARFQIGVHAHEARQVRDELRSEARGMPR